ncbi:NAD(P)-binding protein [Suillus subalutaceus]|uniref:NAD(P)-binding protein n=1 Tax=Suillus subalutaceus TaxID=48586 RepID=UPI001B885AD8|nr:NAD(P)-binding protein [Suillus subalutaceus]KAG1856359.1 NAD(P)-binding protein [Suillus subalutaceus]
MGFFSKSFDPATDLPDLSGKVILITGGNTGIGYSTVKHLARRGAKVYMAARNQTKAEEAIAQLKAEGLGPGNGDVIWLELDLKDPRNAKKAAEEFMKQEKRLDVLSHLLENYTMTPDGVQEIVMVNVISHIVLTRTLQPLLDQTAAEPNSDVRIVVVASDAHRFVSGDTHFRNLDDLNNELKSSLSPTFARYCVSKLMNMLYAFELQRHLTAVGSPITVIALHPGAVNTFSDKPPLSNFKFIVKPIVSLFFLHPDQGAYNSAFAAASEEVVEQRQKYKGAYLTPVGKLTEPTKVAKDEGLAKELWDTVDKFLEEKGI